MSLVKHVSEKWQGFVCPLCKSWKAYYSAQCANCRAEVPALLRFMAKVEVTYGGGCWLWHGAKASGGYGSFWYKGKNVPAHKYAYQAFKGRVPKGLYVCHSCDVPNCVKPAHLWPGTPADNTHDGVRKGRIGKGLSIAVAFEIRRLRIRGKSQKKLAQMFGVHPSNISLICSGKIWRGEGAECA